MEKELKEIRKLIKQNKNDEAIKYIDKVLKKIKTPSKYIDGLVYDLDKMSNNVDF